MYDPFPSNTQGLNYYWENIYHHEDSITKTSDVFATFYQAFVRVGLKSLKAPSVQGSQSRKCLPGGTGIIKEVTILNQHDQLGGVLALYDVDVLGSSGQKRTVTVETWLAPLSHEELLNLNMSNGPQRLVGLEVMTNADSSFLMMFFWKAKFFGIYFSLLLS